MTMLASIHVHKTIISWSFHCCLTVACLVRLLEMEIFHIIRVYHNLIIAHYCWLDNLLNANIWFGDDDDDVQFFVMCVS